MSHQIQNLIGENALHEGDNAEIDVTVTEDGTAGGTPTNLTGLLGATYAMDTPLGVRVITKTLNAGVTVEVAGSGLMKITLDDTDTQGIPGIYTHVLRIKDSANNKITVFTGEIEIVDVSLSASE